MDTFTRFKFLGAFNRDFLNILNPWPMPNSIVIIDNAKIHMCKEFLDAIHSRGALIFFLPSYCPEYNPIEIGFSLIKRFIQKNCNLTFGKFPKECLDLAFKKCSTDGVSLNIYEHCGCGLNTLNLTIPDDIFQ